MKKLLLFLVPIILALTVFFLILFFISRTQGKGKGALQVTTIPQKSQVFLNGKLIGTTPLCECDANDLIESGSYTIRVEPTDTTLPAFEEKITIAPNVLTVVDRTFGKDLSSEGRIMTLTPTNAKNTSELLITSFPSGASLLLDGNKVGETPLLLKNVTDSDHDIFLKKGGYREKNVRISTKKDYRLEATIFLGVDPTSLLSPTPALSPTPSATPSAAVQKVTILSTPTGFLRVRSEPSVNASEIGQVNPGESYELLEETQGWMKIKLKEEEGWISSQYAEKENTTQ